MVPLWLPSWSHQRKPCSRLLRFWIRSTPKPPTSNPSRQWTQCRLPSHLAERSLSCIRTLRRMDLYYSVVWSLWTTTKPRRRWLLISFHSVKCRPSTTIARTASSLAVFITCSRMMRNSVSLLLMVRVHSLLHFRVMFVLFNKRSALSCQRSMEEVVSQPIVLQESEKKSVVLMSRRLPSLLRRISSQTMCQMWRVLSWRVVPISRQSSSRVMCSINVWLR